MTIEEATAVISVVIIVGHGMGALWNNRRIDKINDALTIIGNRLTRLETIQQQCVEYHARELKEKGQHHA